MITFPSDKQGRVALSHMGALWARAGVEVPGGRRVVLEAADPERCFTTNAKIEIFVGRVAAAGGDDRAVCAALLAGRATAEPPITVSDPVLQDPLRPLETRPTRPRAKTAPSQAAKPGHKPTHKPATQERPPKQTTAAKPTHKPATPAPVPKRAKAATDKPAPTLAIRRLW